MELYKVAYTLQYIKVIESNSCKNTKHKSDATGCYGIRPMALKQIGVKPNFKYSEQLQDIHAKTYANHILSYAKNESMDFLVYGWLKGPSAAKKRAEKYHYGVIPYRNPFTDHWYVKRFKNLTKINNQALVEFYQIFYSLP